MLLLREGGLAKDIRYIGFYELTDNPRAPTQRAYDAEGPARGQDPADPRVRDDAERGAAWGPRGGAAEAARGDGGDGDRQDAVQHVGAGAGGDPSLRTLPRDVKVPVGRFT